MKKVVQFGAGNIGRGFLAQLFTQSGYEVIFVEVKPEIISQLNRERKYTLRIVGEDPHDVLIENISAVSAGDLKKVREEITTAGLIATAVGVNVLPEIAPLIASGIKCRIDRKIYIPLNIIICENLLSAGKVLRDYIRNNIPEDYYGYIDRYVGFVETVVSRMIPVVPEEIRREAPLFVMAEEYSILPVSRNGFVGEIPVVKGMTPIDNLTAYEERKLFIHNLGHAICAYAGYKKGYEYIWETVLNEEIIFLTRKSLDESGRALIEKYGFAAREMHEHVDDLIKRFGNRALGDTVYRVGRDPVRKLGPDDRLIGSAKLCLQFNINPEYIVKGIACALSYDYEGDNTAKKLKHLISSKGVDYILREICGLSKEEKLANLIKKEFEEVKKL